MNLRERCNKGASCELQGGYDKHTFYTHKKFVKNKT